MSIQLLPTEVAAKIAAGEVVERPACVVKELAENAIDAGTTTDGGLRLNRVSDNGRGIPAGELELALARHAISKIRALDDLERIQTLGLRGEALASIAAAQLTLTSRPPESEVAATLTASSGAAGQVSTAGAPIGTTVSVRDLFASVLAVGVGDAVDAFLASLRTRAAPANTIKAYCQDLRLFAQTVPGELAEVTPTVILAFLEGHGPRDAQRDFN